MGCEEKRGHIVHNKKREKERPNRLKSLKEKKTSNIVTAPLKLGVDVLHSKLGK